nr:HTH-type transcriptional activator IlvY [Desulfobulbaceae bacterium]
MDIQSLKLFKQLAENLHFGKTSQACHINPSALTRTVQRLEDELGEKLFVRDNRSVTLTPPGKLFKEYAEETIARYNELRNKISTDGILRGEISLYSSVTAVYSILPSILEGFRELYPQVHINLQTGDAAMALNKLERGDVDVTIAAMPDQIPGHLAFKKITETPLVFITPTRFPEIISKFDSGDINWQKTPFVMAEKGLSRKRVDSWFAQKDIQPYIYAKVAGNEAIIAFVSLGCGIGVVPKLVLEKSPLKDQISTIDVMPQLRPFSVGICVVQKKISNPIIKAFWDNAECRLLVSKT